MRSAGRVVAEMHEECTRVTKPGSTTLDVELAARAVLERRGARSSFLGYHGFPAVVCTSPNEVIVHGIPSETVILEEGDILSVDCGAIIEGWHADAALTIPVGEIDDESTRLLEVTRASLNAAIGQIVEGRRLGDVGAAVEAVAVAGGFSVVREYVGHGIGTSMHEEPQIPNYGVPGRGLKLKQGYVVAIEPMVNAGGPETEVLGDGWTVVTRDRRRSAHFEHTIAVTDHGPEILTLP
jgi:methionyl aminopeptidase